MIERQHLAAAPEAVNALRSLAEQASAAGQQQLAAFLENTVLLVKAVLEAEPHHTH